MNKQLVLLSIYLLFPLWLLAQNKVTLSGYLKDERTGEALIGATIYVENEETGAASNVYGFYSISLKPGSYTMVFSSMGYQSLSQQINLIDSRKLDISLSPQSILTDEVIITSKRADENVSSTQMGVVTLSTETIKKLPVLFGESDVLKAIQLMPGVQSAGEGNAGFYVRGGGPDQNLIVLDDAVVYNTGHLFGFFSVFNSDAVKNITLTKGGMTANYGGRLSSVLDVNMKEGNMKKFEGEGGLGLIASRLTLQGPIVKDKGSFMISGRRTYIDVLTKPFIKGSLKGSGYYFYDANIKANYRISEKDKVYLSGYFGRDVFKFSSGDGDFAAKIPWGNATATLRWNHQFNHKLFANTSLIFNDYKFSFGGEQNDFSVKFNSAIRDYGIKTDFDYFTSFGHTFKAGAMYTYHKFTPNQVSGTAGEEILAPDNSLVKFAHEAAVYVMDEFDLGKRIKINAGLRYSWFGQLGPYEFIQNQQGVLDTLRYTKGELVTHYGGIEPRINARFTISSTSSLKASVSRSNQYLHLVSNNGSTLPTDIWVPSSKLVLPQKAWQYSLGYFQNLWDNKVETSIEIYYKDMRNQVEYRSGYTPATFRDPELDFVFGKGYAYGAEFFVNKTQGKFTGWIGYTLSWTWREFKELNQGVKFPAKYDRRHDLSVVGTYEHNKKWTFSSIFIYGSGNAITLPTGLYFIENNLVQNNSALNQYRIFPYHRLDLSAVWTPKPDSHKRWKSTWAFSVYNIYSRQNPYFLYLDMKGNVAQGTDIKVKQVSIFPILPSITYNFKF